MRYMFCLLFLMADVSYGEVLWEWDFVEIPSGWEANQYWDFSDSGAHSYVQSDSSGLNRGYQTSEMFSDTLTIPSPVTSIKVSLASVRDYNGWYTTGESNCFLWARLGIAGVSMQTLEYETHYWGAERFSESAGIISAEVDIHVFPGDLIYFTFQSHAGSSSSYGAYAMMDWIITSLTISSDSTSLSRQSWGGIKSSF